MMKRKARFDVGGEVRGTLTKEGFEVFDTHKIVERTPLSAGNNPRVLSPSQQRGVDIVKMRQAIREEMSNAALGSGHETFAEAEDFEVDGQDSFRSPFEEDFEPFVQPSADNPMFRENAKRKESRDAEEALDTSLQDSGGVADKTAPSAGAGARGTAPSGHYSEPESGED